MPTLRRYIRWPQRPPSRRVSVALLLAFVIIAAYTSGAFHVSLPRAAGVDQPTDLTLDRVPAPWQPGEFECVAWRAMSGCDPLRGQRTPASDQSCDSPIASGLAGYCEVRNRTSGATYRVMATSCHSTGRDVTFTCSMANHFTDFAHAAENYVHDPAPIVSSATTPTRGIAFSIYPKLVPSVYAIVLLLRTYGCSLPIELFYRPEEMDPRRNYVLQRLVQTENVALRAITDPRATKFRTKPYAVYHSSFDQVLVLDCDNIPLRDPTYLFDTPEFQADGAIFWPDYWQPTHTLFHVDADSLLWEYLNLPFYDMFEQESGQVLVDRSRAGPALHRLMAYTFSPTGVDLLEDLELVYGDKDLFRLAYLGTNTSFHYIKTLPVAAGTQLPWRVQFCGLAMGQLDPKGDLVFLHRNSVKLSGDAHQVPVITHLQRFDQTAYSLDAYRVAWTGEFNAGQPCWGFPWPLTPSVVEVLPPTHPVVQAERKVLAFAVAAGNLLLGARQQPAVQTSSVLDFLDSWALTAFLLVAVVWLAWRTAARRLPPAPLATTWRHLLGPKKKRKTSSIVQDMLLSLVFLAGSLVLVLGGGDLFAPATLAPTGPRPHHRVPAIWRGDEFECLGWRATTGCTADGSRVPSADLPCNATVARGMSGYCEVRNRTSGDVYYVMQTACDSVDSGASFTCADAEAFTNYPIQAAAYVHPVPPPSGAARRGIVFSIYEDAVPGVYAIIQLLRSPLFNCSLPIELFYEPHKFFAPAHVLLRTLLDADSSVRLRTIDDPTFNHFRTKPYALYHSTFDQVLLLDCDNIPLKDPTYLFDLLNATTTAVFWPDYWQPSYSIFNVHEKSLLWQYVDMPFVGGFEQESGQVLVDRVRSRAALHKLLFYTLGPLATNATANFLESKQLLYGDKDLFRLAWRNTSTPAHFIAEPPAFAGVYRWWLSKFCGLSIVQYDVNGDMIFLHRNMVKLSGDKHQLPLLRDVARFNTSLYNASEHYQVECKGNQLGGKTCWGFKWPFVPYQLTPVDDTNPIHIVETLVLKFAMEAGDLGRLQQQHERDPPPVVYEFDMGLGFMTFAVVGVFACRWHRRRRLRKAT
ncbi:hypothetical protein ACHHYP_05574 [Achlya hypogyna]|uniref:Uncharacterized protein n=1 Tax=Achlya hypogyna TaxID=1202772 RepID=A0A1V9YXC2_ACHHY|nr:hypothetical protein ACHHYP_05574 [Achlya hypogyna]